MNVIRKTFATAIGGMLVVVACPAMGQNYRSFPHLDGAKSAGWLHPLSDQAEPVAAKPMALPAPDAMATASRLSLQGWEAVALVLPVIVGLAMLARPLVRRGLIQLDRRRERRQIAQYLPGPDGRIPPRPQRGVPSLLSELGVGARDRFKLLSGSVAATPWKAGRAAPRRSRRAA